MTRSRIGFIGMGLMGVPMSLRLLAAGYPLCVWNRSPDKTEPLLAAGAMAANSIQQLVENSDIVMLCVSDTAAVESVVFAQDGLINSVTERHLIIDFSSIAPEATRKMAEQLKSVTGTSWIDAPVSGGVAGAEQGTLAIMAGGDAAEIDKVRPLLAHLSQRVTRMGEVGAGQVTKICNQMIVSCNVLVMAEVMALAEKAGVDASQLPVALKGGFADSIPLQLTGPRMASSEFEPVKWHVKTLLKDLDMAKVLSQNLGRSTPMAGLGAELMRLHASQGHNNSDPSTLISLYRESKG